MDREIPILAEFLRANQNQSSPLLSGGDRDRGKRSGENEAARQSGGHRNFASRGEKGGGGGWVCLVVGGREVRGRAGTNCSLSFLLGAHGSVFFFF
jgi:hypothetical protein